MSKSISEKYIALCNDSGNKVTNSHRILRTASVESSSESAINHKNQLKRVIWNEVMELDRTKASFKSKRIEKIKNDLLKVLLNESVQ